jgi:hypothetical protein
VATTTTSDGGAAPTPSTAAATGQSDSPQAFAASAEDEKTDTSQIPDPATFGATTEADGKKSNDADKAASATVDTRPAQEKSVTATTANNPVAAPTAAAAPAVPKMNPLLVAGLPIAAVVVLMGVYWLILRAGAV